MPFWYKHLNNEDKSKKSLLDYVTLESNNLIVCQELEFRNFAKFMTIFLFASYLFKEVQLSHRCFYEYIFGNFPQKPYFDLDIPLKKKKTKENENKKEFTPRLGNRTPSPKKEIKQTLTAEEAEMALIELIESILRLYPKIKKTDIMIFNSHGEEKRSYHVVVDNYCFTNSSGNRNFFNEILKTYPEEFKFALDSSMYKSIQAFRMFESHKWGAPERIKKIDYLSKWMHPLENNEDMEISNDHMKYLTFYSSLITNTSYCEILPNYGTMEEKKVFDEVFFEENEILNALLLCAKNEGCNSFENGNFPYSIREVKGGLIVLKRLRPSFCKLCNRSHENENPFLTIKKGDNSVFFNCNRRQDEEKTSILLGYIQIKKEEEVKIEEEEKKEIDIFEKMSKVKRKEKKTKESKIDIIMKIPENNDLKFQIY